MLRTISQWRRSFFHSGISDPSNAITRTAVLLRSGRWCRYRLAAPGIGNATGVDRHRLSVDDGGPVVEAARRRACVLLSDAAVLRTVARALEPLRRLTERHSATEVHALLVERDDPVLHALDHDRPVDRLCLRDVFLGVQLDVRARFGDVEGLVLSRDLRLDVVEGARRPSPCRRNRARFCSGQRNASIAGANPAAAKPTAVSRPRLRNCRRVTPSSSSSTGSYSTTAPPRRRTRPCDACVSSERSRPVASSSVEVDIAAARRRRPLCRA